MSDSDRGSLDELKQLKVVRLAMLPLRIIIAVSVMALAAGGPKHFFADPLGAVFAGIFVVYLVVERIFQAPDTGGKDQDQGSITVIWLTSSAVYLAAIADYYWLRPHWSLLSWNWIWVAAGSGTFALGLLLRVQAMRTLGRFFTISVRTHQEHKLIQEGLYARVRHPAYTGLLLIVLGFATVFASLIGYAVCLVAALPGLLNRIRIEERALGEVFGEAYLDYCKKTSRLVPFIY